MNDKQANDTITDAIETALAGQRKSVKLLRAAIAEACAALPIGANLGGTRAFLASGGELTVRTHTVPCTQSGTLGSGWPVHHGSARTLLWRGHVVDREDAGWFDNHNMQHQCWTLDTAESDRAAKFEELRECANDLPAILREYLGRLATEEAGANEAVAALQTSMRDQRKENTCKP